MNPRFYVDPSAIQVRTTEGPQGFHSRLIKLIRGAKRQLSLASLYLGTGQLEAELLEEIAQALRRQDQLRVTLVADHSRGRRRTAQGGMVAFTRALARAFPSRLRVCLHRMPQLHGLGSLMPSPLNETLAVFHVKAIVADDVAILTGANLSDEYFHCRQCRAIEVRDQAVTGFLHEVVEQVARHSHALVDGELARPERPSVQVAQAMLELTRRWSSHGEATDTWLEPVFQHPGLGLHQERSLLTELFARPDGDLEIHTSYTNFPALYIDALRARHQANPGAVT